MLRHSESPDVAKSVDKLLAEPSSALLSMRTMIEKVRESTGTDRSDADLQGLITKKAAMLGMALLPE